MERGIAYVKGNGLAGHRFDDLAQQNQHLQEWENGVADTRIHGTTRQQVIKVFEAAERPALLPLPSERFPFFHESLRTVQRDGHVAVAQAYYSVPPEYVGRRVWARWDAHLVKIFNHRREQIAVHGPTFKGFRSLRTTFANLVPRGFSEERKLIMGHSGDITLQHYVEKHGTKHLRRLVDEVWLRAFSAPWPRGSEWREPENVSGAEHGAV